jgi:hypothetical protein
MLLQGSTMMFDGAGLKTLVECKCYGNKFESHEIRSSPNLEPIFSNEIVADLRRSEPYKEKCPLRVCGGALGPARIDRKVVI